jgi:hypothetical protein
MRSDRATWVRSVYRDVDLFNQSGFWFPKVAVREVYRLPQNLLLSRYAIHVSNVRVNRAPDSLFTKPAMPPGSKLYDQDVNVLYTTNGAGRQVVDELYAFARSKTRPSMTQGWLLIVSATVLLLLALQSFVRWQSGRRLA